MKKKRKKKKKLKPPTNEFSLFFNDPTMVETEGSFERVRDIIENEFPFPNVWTIKTGLNILSQFGESGFLLDFNSLGEVWIVGYNPPPPEVYSPDLSCLSRWCQDAGWKVPQPLDQLVQDNTTFWKEKWLQSLVNSPYLTERYGLRPSEDPNCINDVSDRMENMTDDDFIDEPDAEDLEDLPTEGEMEKRFHEDEEWEEDE